MLFITLIVASIALVAADLRNYTTETSGPHLGQTEEQFEESLQKFINNEETKHVASSEKAQSGCTIRINDGLGRPQPVFIRNGAYLSPNGNTGNIQLNSGEQLIVSCTGLGRTIQHANMNDNSVISTALATCVTNNIISGEGWMNNDGEFGGLTCNMHSLHSAEQTAQSCYDGNQVIRVGYIVLGIFYPLYWSCFDRHNLQVLYVWYDQRPENAEYETGVPRPNTWLANFFPNIDVDKLYTQNDQKQAIAYLVGSQLAEKYITSTQHLTHGHLAAKTDFIFATGQRASFYHVNAAPQWNQFNSGNWNLLEQNLRALVGRVGYKTVIYTGTFGVTQLRDQDNRLVDIYLYRDINNNLQFPVPLYFYKVIYDEALQRGTAFVGINNPHYTLDEARALQFCTDRCRGNSGFTWLQWQPDNVDMGYSFCCDIEEFRNTVPHLPEFTVTGLLTGSSPRVDPLSGLCLLFAMLFLKINV